MNDNHSALVKSLENMQINTLFDINSLEAIVDDWDDLLTRCQSATIFQTSAWTLAFIRHFQPSSFFAVTVRCDDKLVGLAIFEIRPIKRVPVKRVRFLSTGFADYNDIIVDINHSSSVIEAIFAALPGLVSGGMVLDLRQIPSTSPLLDCWHIATGSTLKGWQVQGADCPYIDLPDNWESYTKTLGKKLRWNMSYYERLLRKNYDVVIESLSPDDFAEGMQALYRLHTLRWNSKNRGGVLGSQLIQDFHNEFAGAFLPDKLRLYSIRLNGELQAIIYCFHFQGVCYHYQGGFNPEFMRYSLGTILVGFAIRDAIEQGCHRYDFLRGVEAYKLQWSKTLAKTGRLVIANSSLFARFIAFGITKVEHANEYLRVLKSAPIWKKIETLKKRSTRHQK